MDKLMTQSVMDDEEAMEDRMDRVFERVTE